MVIMRRQQTNSLPNAAVPSDDSGTVTTGRRRTRSLSNDAFESNHHDNSSAAPDAFDATAFKPLQPSRGRSRIMSREEDGNDGKKKDYPSKGNNEKKEQQTEKTEPTNQIDICRPDNTDESLKDKKAKPANRNDDNAIDGNINHNEKKQMDDSDDDLDFESSRNAKPSHMVTADKLSTCKNAKKTKMKNELTHLIPGYTAPMELNSSSLDKFRPKGGIQELQRLAERTDASTKDFVLEATTKLIQAMAVNASEQGGCLPKSYTAAYSSFKRGTKRAPDPTAGKGWFGMTPTPMTEQVKTDLAVIRNRTYLDPKRFYKSADKHHKIIQMGTVVEGPSEYFSSRLTKKQRRSNLTEEIMADRSSSSYAKNKYKQMSQEKSRQAEMRKTKSIKRVKKFY